MVVEAEAAPGLLAAETLHQLQMGAHQEVVGRAGGHMAAQQLGERVSVQPQSGLEIAAVAFWSGNGHAGPRRRHGLIDLLNNLLIDRVDQRQAAAEQAGAEGFGGGGGFGAALTEKEFEVLAKVENPEALLIAAGSEEVFAGAGAAPHHLPELGARTHRLEEHQIDNLGDVDAGIEHVHRNGDAQIAGWIGKLINK